MGLNKVKGNMYNFVTHTFNVIKGKCKHNCIYCYMKRFPQKDLWFDEKELKIDLGKDNFIFIGSSTDMFAEDVKDEWIMKVLEYCKKFDNTYLFQSKNPERFLKFTFPYKTILGTTIETNDVYNYEKYSKAPLPSWRLSAMEKIPFGIKRMITIEPIIDFIPATFHLWIKEANPDFVNIGADSNSKKDYSFPEPSEEKILELIEKLKQFTEVRVKENLSRILNQEKT